MIFSFQTLNNYIQCCIVQLRQVRHGKIDRVLELVSAMSIVYILKEEEIMIDSESAETLCTILLLKTDDDKIQCSEFDYLVQQFPGMAG